jgi:hypothetical protein
MYTVKAIYDGSNFKLDEPVPIKGGNMRLLLHLQTL